MVKEKSCKNLEAFIKAQIDVVKKEIRNQPNYDKITHKRKYLSEKVKEFAEKHGEVSREWYCGYICHKRQDCVLAEKYLNTVNDDDFKE